MEFKEMEKRMLYQTEGSERYAVLQEIEKDTLYPYEVSMVYRDGTKAEVDIEKWEAMELCEKDALKSWRYLYAPEQATEWQHYYSGKFSQWREQAFSYMEQDLEERMNTEYMLKGQNPDTDMYRIPLGTAKQMRARHVKACRSGEERGTQRPVPLLYLRD